MKTIESKVACISTAEFIAFLKLFAYDVMRNKTCNYMSSDEIIHKYGSHTEFSSTSTFTKKTLSAYSSASFCKTRIVIPSSHKLRKN